MGKQTPPSTAAGSTTRDDAGKAPSRAVVDVVVLGASAGGLAALWTVLRDLPAGFPVPLLAMLHLPPDFRLDGLFSRFPMPVAWAREGELLGPGRLLVAPPRSFLEVLPNGACTLSPCEGGALERPIDRLLESVGRSFGERAIGVVLTGMGDDAAAGARALRRVGGAVLVQSAASSEHPSMPRAAIAAGGATMVLPLAELGHVVGELVEGKPRRQLRAEVEAIRRVFGDRGEMAALARERDWSATPLGAALSWSDELRVIGRTVLASRHPAAVWWGPDFVQIYNDAWRRYLGVVKHPAALGLPARQTWGELWPEIAPLLQRVTLDGVAQGQDDLPVLIERESHTEETFVTFSYAPVHDAAGEVAGVHVAVWETTRNVVAERRLKALRDLAAQMAGADDPRSACERAMAALDASPEDVPFALVYEVDTARRQATLAAVAGLAPGSACAPHVAPLVDDTLPWPVSRALGGGPSAEVRLDDLAVRCRDLPPTVSPRAGTVPPRGALLLPLGVDEHRRPTAVLVLALSPHRAFDDGYRRFVDLLVAQVAAGIAVARSRRLERERGERLAELDRAKTQFFAHISHEFRTPLTLLLAPLEELLRRRELLPGALAADVDTAARNARRLLTLVTNLLDFSQIESARRPARLVPHDLGRLTSDIASHFRSAIEGAGLRLRVEVPPDLPRVPVDPEMWTKILSNLLSNAFKFTFEGEIVVALKALRLHAELVVADTGVGVPEHELPHLFKRFHRVTGARARTAEGAGIGLAIVQDLVERLGGQLQVRSRLGAGTEFTVWLPYKSFRQTGEASHAEVDAPAPTEAVAVAEEAARWMPGRAAALAGVAQDLLDPPRPDLRDDGGGAPRERLLVIDDNADMRDFLRRLLGAHWDVAVAGDGDAGLASAREQAPTVIVADVMMPGLGGFDLLARLRADAGLRQVPVVLVSARAGEEAAIEGLQAGADDYIAKPFSPRELVARVRAVIDRGRVESALRASEVGLRLALDAAQMGTFVWHPQQDRGEFDARNLALFGLQPQDTLDFSRTMLELIPREDRAAHAAAVARALDPEGDGVLFSEHRIRRPSDGAVRWIAAVGQTTFDSEPRRAAVMRGVCADVTDRKRMEEALRHSEEGYRALFDSIDEGFCVIEVLFDDGGRPVDYRFLETNPAFVSHTGLADAAGRSVLELAPHLEPFWFEVYGDIARRGRARRFEHEARALDRWFDVYAFPTGDAGSGKVAVLFKDITESRRSQHSMRESEARFRAFVTASSDVVYRMSADWSEMRELDGQGFVSDPPEPSETWMNRYVHPDDQPLVRQAIARAVTDRGLFELEHRVRRPDGTLGWTLSRAIPLLGEAGEIVEWLGAARDVTARKRTDLGEPPT